LRKRRRKTFAIDSREMIMARAYVCGCMLWCGVACGVVVSVEIKRVESLIHGYESVEHFHGSNVHYTCRCVCVFAKKK